MMMKIWGMTDIGLVRRENQDAYAVHDGGDSGYTVCVVCDGMGGPSGGKLAGRLAADTFLAVCTELLREDMDPEQVRETVSLAVNSANTAVYERSLTEPGLRGMGTTLVSAISRNGRAVIHNVGDSRAYLIRAGGEQRGIRRVTRDHSVVEEMVERGEITEEEARIHPRRNLITRALGPEQETLSDSYLVSLDPGDCLLLCTDGLTGTVTDREMEREVLSGDEDRCLDRLLALAKRQGAPDNVTAVLLKQV